MTPEAPQARWWRALPDAQPPGTVECELCPQDCRIRPGHRGICRYRVNDGGTLRAKSYGRVSSYGYDPIEKKPLYHFMPGAIIFSAGTVGCNLGCGFCQNWQISQSDAGTTYLSPEQSAILAGADTGAGRRSVGIAYTYSEPLVWWEYVYDTAREVREHGLVNVLVTNGFIEEEPLRELLPYVDAMNIDVKAFKDGFYREVCHGRLAPVLRTVEVAHAQGVHVEVTTLLIPGLNDEPDEIKQLVHWLAGVDRGIPLHFSRYFPNYRMAEPGPTPLETLVAARDIAREKLDFAYIGNALAGPGVDTECPACGTTVIKRDGYRVSTRGLRGDSCARCGRRIVTRARGVNVVN